VDDMTFDEECFRVWTTVLNDKPPHDKDATKPLAAMASQNSNSFFFF
jgi:hypothetical protein